MKNSPTLMPVPLRSSQLSLKDSRMDLLLWSKETHARLLRSLLLSQESMDLLKSSWRAETSLPPRSMSAPITLEIWLMLQSALETSILFWTLMMRLSNYSIIKEKWSQISTSQLKNIYCTSKKISSKFSRKERRNASSLFLELWAKNKLLKSDQVKMFE